MQLLKTEPNLTTLFFFSFFFFFSFLSFLSLFFCLIQNQTNRPLAPVVKSIDIQYTAISPRIDEPELDQQQSFSSPPSSSTTTGNGQYYKDVSWMTASRIGSNYVVRLPIDTEPQRAGLATTVAQVLGIVKLVGCSS